MEMFAQAVKIFARWPAVVAMASAMIFFWREYRHHPKIMIREVIVTAITVAITWAITIALKFWIAAPRPFVVSGLPNRDFMVFDYTSFPSGHATMFFALATAIFLYNKKSGLLLYSFALVIVVSRVIVGIHYPIDVIVGAGIGVVVAWVVHRWISRVAKKDK